MPEQLADAGDPRVRLADAADVPALAACYERVARASNGMIDRDSERWKQHLEAPARHAWVADDGAISGYMIVRYGEARAPDRRPLLVLELVTVDDDAYVRLLGWIHRQRDLWRRVSYDAHPDEHFGLRLADPRPPGALPARWLWANVARVIRGPMFRLLDVPRALTLRRRWGGAAPCAFDLTVADEQIPANRGPWRCTFDGGRVHVRPAEASAPHGGESVAARLAADAATMAQIYAGEITVSAAVRLGTATCEGATAALDALFAPASRFRLLDEF